MISARQQAIDLQYMGQALEYAQQAADLGEVPVGAILVRDGQVLGFGLNRCAIDHDPSAHAEVLALRSGATSTKNFRLDGATLYVTVEPCLMCCGALLQARVQRLVFGAREPRTGGVVSIHEALRLPGVEHHIAVSEGVCADAAAKLMQRFFRKLR